MKECQGRKDLTNPDPQAQLEQKFPRVMIRLPLGPNHQHSMWHPDSSLKITSLMNFESIFTAYLEEVPTFDVACLFASRTRSENLNPMKTGLSPRAYENLVPVKVPEPCFETVPRSTGMRETPSRKSILGRPLIVLDTRSVDPLLTELQREQQFTTQSNSTSCHPCDRVALKRLARSEAIDKQVCLARA